MSLTSLLPIDITPAGFKTWCEAVSAEADALGTAATEDVTTSEIDTTAGRLLKVGDFGLGALDIFPLPPNSDLNDIVAAGFYTASSSDVLNRPQSSTVLHLTRTAVAGSRYTQMAFGGNASGDFAPDLHIRQFNSDGWSEWRKIYSEENILGPVSESSGVPTGGIIERGSNSNGEYVKFADGTMLCWHELTGIDTTDSVGNIFRSGSATSWVYPIEPVGAPASVMANAASSFRWANAASPGGSSASIYGLSALSNTGVTIQVMMVGRWYE